MKKALIIIAAIICFIAFIFLANEFSIFGTNFWGVRKANANRAVYEQSQSCIDGKRQELTKLHHEWMNSDAESKLAIENMIRNNFSAFNPNNIQDDKMRLFLTGILNN